MSCCGSRSAGTLLEIQAGDSWAWSTSVKDSSGRPVDLTVGYTALAQARPRPGSATVLIEWSSEAGNLVVTAAGAINLLLSPADTADLTFKRAVWGLELTNPAGVVSQLDGGRIRVIPDVVR